jgi:transposase
MLEVKEVLRLWLRGIPKKRIAAERGLDIKTVRRYVKVAVQCGVTEAEGEAALDEVRVLAVMERLQGVAHRPRGDGWARCEAERSFIKNHLDHGVRLSKVRKLLRRKGVLVSDATLRRFAASELAFGRGATTIPVADCGPGEEMQLDTGWMTLLDPDLAGRRRRFRAWIFTPVVSRFRFVYPVFSETTASAIEACETAWAFYGGVYRVLIVDNTKAIVQDPDPLSPKLNLGFLEYSQARGFVIDTTRVRRPRDKARVEASVKTVRDDCFAGERLRDLDHAREHAHHWSLEEYGLKRHGTTQRLPREHFEAEEQRALLPAPKDSYDVPLWCDPKVARDQHALVAKSLYSLPTRFVGKTLRARADRTTVRFYEGALLVKAHARVPPGKRSTDPSDFPKEKTVYAMRDIDFLARKAAEHGPSVGGFAKALLASPLPWTRMRQVYALLGLAKRYGDSRLDEACATALQADMIDVYRLRRLLELARPPAPGPDPNKVVPLARYLRPPKQYALPLPMRERTDKGDNA